MSGAYEGRQIVGLDLHRRRSVLVRMTETGERLSLAIVGSHEADIFSGKISDESPLGQALLGKKVGDVVEIRGKKGAQVYTILEIKPL